jgi:hypothetical protein
MPKSESEYINLCKKQIEQKFSFGNGGNHTQRDLEALSACIEEKSGVMISLSTLKRLWKDDYKQSPQLATLNALAVTLDHKDWYDFKKAQQSKGNPKQGRVRWIAVAVVALVICGVAFFVITPQARTSTAPGKTIRVPAIKGPVRFEATKTVSSGIPNTVIFKYDVSKIDADSFYIQQSWNDDHRVAIDPAANAVTSIYYESGFHRAKLIANDSIIATQPVHILSNGWEPHLYRSDSEAELIDLKNENFIANGMLHLDSVMLTKRKIDFSDRFHTRITNSRVFNVHSDNFSFSTRMKADRVFDQLCGWMDLIIVTDVQTFSVSWTEKGCEKHAAYKLGEISKSGSNNDLSALGCDIYDWQDLEIKVNNRHAAIYLNGRLTYEETYKQDFGKIVALIYIFDGTGSIDFARLKNGEQNTIFEADFEK